MSTITQPTKKIDATHILDDLSKEQDNKYNNIMASVEIFKSSVIRIRDILRGPGVSITGMDSMRHICLYLLSRYMTRAKVASLEVPEEFAWETLIETAQTKNGGVQKALDCFYHTEEDCLVRHFDRLFGTDKFTFDIKNPQKHKEILEILNPVNMANVDCQMDILGWVYEQHLKTGSSSASRDLGQFFTDRFICEYMVELCKPGFKSLGVPESVCDPSMGTGGFLTAFIKYFRKHHADKPIDWSVQQKEIHGCDTDPKVAGVSRLNLFMETGGNRTTNLLTHDSLYGDLTQTGYDVILANMPFGLKSIKHADCCERVKALKIRGTKSEPLFLQLMMVSLNRGGRCAVVVPDGMLVNASECHNGTRKYLLDHFELKRVIKMSGKFFLNTGIRPSILFFEKTGKPTKTVEFWKVVKGDKGEITETMMLSVSRDKMDASCSLDMRRYMQSEKLEGNPAGFPMVKLGDVCDLLSGKGNYTQDGDAYPYYDSNGPTGTRKDFLYDGEFVITARKMSIGAVHYVSGKYWASDNTINIRVKPDSALLSRFLYYWLFLNNKVLKDLSSGIKPGIRKSDVAEIKMPLPPLPIQQEIVATLDRIYAPGTTELADTLKLTTQAMDLVLANPGGATLEPIVEAQRLIRKSAQMVADVKAQMVAIVKSVGSRGFPMVKLGDIIEILGGKRRTIKEATDDGEYDFITCSIMGTSRISVADFNKEAIIINAINGSGKCRPYYSDKYSTTTNNIHFTLKSDCKTISLKYIHGYLELNINLLEDGFNGGNQKKIGQEYIKSIFINAPPLAFQHSLVARLDALQTQLTALESLQKQSENNARFILESHLGSASPSIPVEESKKDTVDESSMLTNEIIHPEESSVASTKSPVHKVVKRKKPAH